MELLEKGGYLELSPQESIRFRVESKAGGADACLKVRNRDRKKIAFKIKASNNKCFKMSIVQGILNPQECVDVTISYDYSRNNADSVHKFLIIAVPIDRENLEHVDWIKNAQEYKLTASIEVDLIKYQSRDKSENLKDEIMLEIKKLQSEIEHTKEKIKESKIVNYLTHEEIDTFDRNYLLAFFLVGFLIGVIVYFSN